MTNTFLQKHINQRGSQTALVDSLGKGLSWTQLGQRVDDKADQLLRLDLSQPIIHRSENTTDDVVMAIAAGCVGAIEAPLDHRISEAEYERRTKLLQRRSSESDRGSDVPPGVILWTSGTTAQAQGVVLSHEAWLGNAAAKLKAVPQLVDDVRLTVLPISHAYARTCDLGTWLISGCTLAITLGMKGLRRTAPLVRPTLVNGVPSIAYALLDQDLARAGMDRVRSLGVGGAPLSAEAFRAWKQRGVTVIQGYGLTETGPVICSATPENATAGLVGDFVEGWQHQIRGGQLWVRGPHLMQGYWQEPAATADRFDHQGWFNTNDLVEVDSTTGQCRILGRADDVIVLDNAIKIHPSVIEREVEQLAQVNHAMLVKCQDLELWIDGTNVDDSLIRQALKSQLSSLSFSIHHFKTPLSLKDGELTAKGTLRRNEIVRRRLASQRPPPPPTT